MWQQFNSGTLNYKNCILPKIQTNTNKQRMHTQTHIHIRAHKTSHTNIECRKSIKIKVIWIYTVFVCVHTYIHRCVSYFSFRCPFTIEREQNNNGKKTAISTTHVSAVAKCIHNVCAKLSIAAQKWSIDSSSKGNMCMCPNICSLSLTLSMYVCLYVCVCARSHALYLYC